MRFFSKEVYSYFVPLSLNFSPYIPALICFSELEVINLDNKSLSMASTNQPAHTEVIDRWLEQAGSSVTIEYNFINSLNC